MDTYPLRNIDDDLWRSVKIRAMTDGVSVRDVLLLGLQTYRDRGLDAFGPPPVNQNGARKPHGRK